MSRSLNTKHGFSLIELITALGISGIILGAITATFISQSRSYDAQEQINGMQQAARAAMDMITREVRMAGYDPTSSNNFGIAACSATSIQILADVVDPADGDPTGANEDITYAFDDPNDELLREAETLVEDIEAFNFDCLDENGLATVTLPAIRQIQVSITARTAKSDPNYTANGGYRTYTLTSLITPRNLAY